MAVVGCIGPKKAGVHLLEMDPQFDQEDVRPRPGKDLKEVQVGPEPHKKTKIGAFLESQIEGALVRDAFTWSPTDMPDIDLDFLCHSLSIAPRVHLVSQKKRRLGEEKKKRLRLR
ncbi:hypothetical protein CR513_02288, partial [Mucuna pruriens]